MRIAVDVMGGDFAPAEIIKGAELYLKNGGPSEIILVGRESAIKEHMPSLAADCFICAADEVIEMGEAPMQALKKKKSASIAVAANLVKTGRADALISAGSTGAQMAASLLQMGRISGVERPAIPIMLPTYKNEGMLFLDVGANVDCRPRHLFQFAQMGVAYYKGIFGVEHPSVGILNIGSEASKGNELTKAVYQLLKDSSMNFVGNIEGDSLFEGCANVVVCDGFAGNVVLKVSESLSGYIQGTIFKVAKAAALSDGQVGALKDSLKRFNPNSPEFSAAPLLGLNGVSMVCHGKSRADVIAGAVALADSCVSKGVVKQIHKIIANEAAPAELLQN